jgi:hypothetical protein
MNTKTVWVAEFEWPGGGFRIDEGWLTPTLLEARHFDSAEECESWLFAEGDRHNFNIKSYPIDVP